ncbi:MAG: hypothetical protein GY788_11810, partial [bacterium]|nr:hypothetical protein [bacterium]
TTNEDTGYTFTASDFGYSDVDADTLDHITITSVESAGILRLAGVDLLVGSEVSKADIDAGYLVFTPAADASGTSYDSFDFTVNDGTADSASSYAMTIDVTSVNDAPTFELGDGIVTTAIEAGHDLSYSLAMQSDGKILMAGHSNNGSDTDFALTRYNADGTLDTSFGGDGILTTALGAGNDNAYSVTLQDDGKILVSGRSHNGSNHDFALARYNADGTLDTSFSGDGMVTTTIGAGLDQGESVVVQPDGKILVAGRSTNGGNKDFTLVRYNADGTLDTSFSSDGILTTAIGSDDDIGYDVAMQDDGKILVSGFSNNGS